MIPNRCETARQLLLDCKQSDQSMGVFSLAMDDCIELDDAVSSNPQVLQALTHVAHCEACQHWRAKAFDPELFAARARARKYCCVEMMNAVDAEVITWERLGPEQLPYWLLAPQDRTIHFCPWCGGRLPDLPFEESVQA